MQTSENKQLSSSSSDEEEYKRPSDMSYEQASYFDKLMQNREGSIFHKFLVHKFTDKRINANGA
jgi:hypothetical protein